MGFAALLVFLLLSSLGMFWSAMAAGRASYMPTRVARLVLEGITLLSALGASAGVAVAVNGPHPDALAFFVPFLVSAALGFVLAGVLTYVTYAVFGRRGDFSEDLRGSLWVGYGGATQPFGGRRRPL
jgi:hypothetical protein